MSFLQPIFLITDPYLNFFRRLPLQIGGFDLSVIPAIFALNFASSAIATLGAEVPLPQSLPKPRGLVFWGRGNKVRPFEEE